MEDTQAINWFEIITKIIIPTLSIISTLTIGVIIATALKRKEERSKIKQLLIDNYMDYLSAKNIDTNNHINFVAYEVVNEILINPHLYITKAISDENFDIIKAKAIEFRQKVDDSNDNNSYHWSLFMHRFAFLLGKKLYNKEVVELKNNIDKYILGKNIIDNFIATTLNEVALNKTILKNLNSNETFEIEMAIYHIQRLIQGNYIDYERKYIEEYNATIADLIYKI